MKYLIGRKLFGLALAGWTLVSVAGAMEVREFEYTFNGIRFAPQVVVPETDQPLPLILMVPNWMGVTEATIKKAKTIAERGAVVYVADVYSAEVRPTTAEEAGAAAGRLREDRPLMRARMEAAFRHLEELRGELLVRSEPAVAIGFCFGGGAVLEFARTGAPLSAFVSFHGDLLSPTLESDSGQIAGRVLVLHGADDPLVPPDHVATFEQVMRSTGVDWQFNSYGGAVHSFTDPQASMEGVAEYHPVVAARAFGEMERLWGEIFD